MHEDTERALTRTETLLRKQETRIEDLLAALAPFVDHLERTEACFSKAELDDTPDTAEIWDGV